jgi:DNA modification methylase
MTTKRTKIFNGVIYQHDAIDFLNQYDGEQFQLIVADPPYFQVLLEHDWDNIWTDADDYLAWTLQWVKACRRVLRPDGLFYIFGHYVFQS